MISTLYKVEVGVLLPNDHPEFDSYNHVFTKDYGFFDEDARLFSTYSEAKAWGSNYINSGADMTYAIVTSVEYKINDVDAEVLKELLLGDLVPDKSWNFGYTKDDILYFAYKTDGEIVERISKKNETANWLDVCRSDKDLYETVHNMLLVLLGKDTEELEEDLMLTGVMSFVGDITNVIIKELWRSYRMRVRHPAVTTEADGNQYYDAFSDE